jgi:peptidoglycan hydrolase CwlO-like protein
MFKFLFKSGLIGMLGAGAVYASGGADEVMDWFKDQKQVVEHKISEMKGMPAELRRIERRVDDLDQEIRRLKEDQFSQEHAVKKTEQDLKDRGNTMKILKSNLEKAQNLLSNDAEYFRIGPATYSRQEVESDVAEKIRLFRVQEETLAHLRQTYVTHQNAIAMAAENVQRGETLRTELQSKVRLLHAKLEKYKARQIYAETIALDFDAQEFNTEIGETRKMFAEFEEKLAVKNRVLDERLKIEDNSSVLGINYDADTNKPFDVRNELTNLLNPGQTERAASPVLSLTENR